MIKKRKRLKLMQYIQIYKTIGVELSTLAAKFEALALT